MISIPTSRRGSSLRQAILAACLLCAAAINGAPGVASGASAEPSGGPVAPDIEAWLDTPIPVDAPAGQPVHIGLTLWNRARQQLGDVNSLSIHLNPARGKAAPTAANAGVDWPGHLVADIVVPRGGPGALAYGVEAQVCTTDGTCTDQESLVPISGTGPPPDAPLSVLVLARVQQLARPLLAGEPIDIAVVLEPHAAWDPATFALPDRVVAIANESRGRSSTSADLPPTGRHPSPSSIEYGGQIMISDPGDSTLQIAIPGNGTEDQVIPGTTTRFTVSGTGPDGSPAAGRSGGPNPPSAPASSPGDGPPWLPIGVLVVVGLGALVVRRVFADL